MSHPTEIKAELIKAHWEMVDALFVEIMLYRRQELAKTGTFLWNLFSDASRDPRFEAIGLTRVRGLLAYTSPMGIQYLADGAPAAMLGLKMKLQRITRNHKGESIAHNTLCAQSDVLGVLMYDWPSVVDFQWWLRWKVQKMRGFTDKDKDLTTGYESGKPKDFPDTLSIINELYPQKD